MTVWDLMCLLEEYNPKTQVKVIIDVPCCCVQDREYNDPAIIEEIDGTVVIG